MSRNGNYSEDFFVKRIQELQEEIRKQLPCLDVLEKNSFLTACKSVQCSIQAKDEAEKLLDDLVKTKCSKEIIAKARDVVKRCEDAQCCAEDTMANAGRPILEKLDLNASVNEASLLECAILIQSTPKRLALWVAESEDTNERLLDSFLGNVAWMKQMILGGGASKGNYGPAISIHSTLLLQIAADGQPITAVRHKLALATALEHATPIVVFKDKNSYIDPVVRCWHYIKAYENNELDENFGNFSVWELRMTVDSDAKDEELTWGREFLKAYRPDEIINLNFPWRYLWSVRSDVGYRHPDHDFFTYKDLISAGGECGPRAFFGRFICKAWGTPTWGVRQPGHAALSRWTPDGWTVCLGAAFNWSSWENRSGPDFLEETEARNACTSSCYYASMSILQCLADSLDETIEEHANPDKLWRSLCLASRRILAATYRDRPLQIRTVFRENIGSHTGQGITNRRSFGGASMRHDSTTMIIPATAFVAPIKPDGTKVLTMESFIGGTQLHLMQDGSVAYKLPSCFPPGPFYLTALIVNIHRQQFPLEVSIENGQMRSIYTTSPLLTKIEIEVPYTGGAWLTTKPVKVEIDPGVLLKITRDVSSHGLTIKEFFLQPA